MKTRLASMGAAEAGRKPKGGVEQDTPNFVDGERERAPGKGVKDSDNPAQSSGAAQTDGRRERAPAKGLKDSDIPAQLLGKTLVDGKREQATVKGVRDSDFPA